MSTLFTKIVRGEIPSFKVYEDDEFFAFLSIAPLTDGHTIVIPKEESESWLDMDEAPLGKLFIVSQKVSKKLKVIFGVPKVAVIVAGFEVPHTHINLIPCRSESELNFSLARNKTASELHSIHERIISEP
jgi:histidine triad (HIT) family protein